MVYSSVLLQAHQRVIEHFSTHPGIGLAIGFKEKGADNRIAQYEMNYRIPKRELLGKIAEVLRADRQKFYTINPGWGCCPPINYNNSKYELPQIQQRSLE